MYLPTHTLNAHRQMGHRQIDNRQMSHQQMDLPIAGPQLRVLFALLALCAAALTMPVYAAEKQREIQGAAVEFMVAKRLAASDSLAGSKIAITREDTTVTLTGLVGSDSARTRAERIAQHTRGVREVQNKLTIDPAVEERRKMFVPDDLLAGNVANSLVDEVLPWASARESWLFGWEVEGGSWEFDVDADDGRILLSGTVDTQDVIAEIGQHARDIDGVKSVENNLRLNTDVPEWLLTPHPGYPLPYPPPYIPTP